MKHFLSLLILSLTSLSTFSVESMSPKLLLSTESDPDAFVLNCCNVINGDYCESATDLVIEGPDTLTLQRFYNNKNYITAEGLGGWRIFPQAFLVLGGDHSGRTCKVRGESFEWIYAYTGERSGGILTYSGWKRVGGDTKDPLKINPKSDSKGMVNTYCGEMNGQTNHLNNRIACKDGMCELTLGDGTKRFYVRVQHMPNRLFGAKLLPTMASKVKSPQYFRLAFEILPSGNVIDFSYDNKGCFSSIEMHNATEEKLHSWIHFTYKFHQNGCTVNLESSDGKTVCYEFENVQICGQSHLILTNVLGSHFIPVSYKYQQTADLLLLTRKGLPEGRFLKIDYDDLGRVKALKCPEAQSGKPILLYAFSYGKGFTDIINAAKIKSRFCYDDQLRISALEHYDRNGKLYRVDRKFYGKKTKFDATFLTARTVEDGCGQVHSYRSFQYDKKGNILEERLYGNLTGHKNISLQVNENGVLLNPNEEDCHIRTFIYSDDGFNLLTAIGDCKGNQTTYQHEKGSNRLSKKLIYHGNQIMKREFRYYNQDAVCTKILEDDGDEEEQDDYNVILQERHITYINPKETLPGVGLPESIEYRALDSDRGHELFVKKLINSFSPQGLLLSCTVYSSDEQPIYTLSKTYNHLGQITSETDPTGKMITYAYDRIGNQVLKSVPYQQGMVATKYDYRNNPIELTEFAGDLQRSQLFSYDEMDRKISSTDRFGRTTLYKYDDFGRLIQLTHPVVLDEYGRPTQPNFRYTYDIFGNVLSITDPKNHTIQKRYNLRGDPSKIDYPDGSFDLFKYDAEGSLHRSLTRDHIITVYEYDYLGRVVHEETSTAGENGVEYFITGYNYSYNGFRLKQSEEDNGVATVLKHDPAGRVIATTRIASGKNADLKSRKTEIIYDSLGRESKKKVWFDVGPTDYSLECFEYDLVGNIIEKRIENADNDPLLLKCYVFDDSNRCIEESSILKGQKQTLLTTSYDPFGEPISYVDALGHKTSITTDNTGDTLTKTVVNPLGAQTIFRFDALGRTSSTEKRDPSGVLLSHQDILYDATGNKSVEIHAVIYDGKQVGIQKTRWLYGPMGRLEQLIEAEGSPDEKSTVYLYNGQGRLESKQPPGLKNPLTYSYSDEGRISKIEYVDGEEILLSHSFSYDKRGNIIEASTQEGQRIRRSYNIFDQVTEEYVEDGEGSYTLEFCYDRKGRLKVITLPDHSSIEYAYDAAFGRKATHLTSDHEVIFSHTYNTYDLLGHLTEETLIGYCGDRKTRYDVGGHKIFVETDYHTEIVPEGGYDCIGNLLSIEREGEFPLTSTTYAYDALAKLVSEKSHMHKIYDYDSVDNRVAEDLDLLHYNDLNQLLSKSDTDYTYDSQGNLLRRTLEGEEAYFESNVLSQLLSITNSDGSSLKEPLINFSYDPFGRRLVKRCSQNNSVSRSFHLGHHELGTLDKTGVIQKLRIPGISGDTISLNSVAVKIDEQSYAVLHDISGHVCALVDPEDREINESYEYTAFGQETIYDEYQEPIKASKIGNPWRYAEKSIDEETGLIWFGFRYYDPSIGRWISQDPLGYLEGPNLYAYCNNNPSNRFDRFGLETEGTSSTFEDYFYGEVEPHCYCERHRTCKRGGDIGKTDNSDLPRVSYCTTFEDMHPQYERSRAYDLGLQEVKNIGIGFINGIWNDFDEAHQNTQYISKLSQGHNIHAVYNATHGKCADLQESRMGLKYVATEPVNQLHNMWNSFFERSSTTSKFLMICHSQGAIHVRNALLDYPPELRDRITVIAIAPAAFIYKETCAQVIHCRVGDMKRDPIPHLFDPDGAQRESDTIINLQSHQDADRFDHSFISPTYESVIRKQIDIYLNGRQL